VWCGGRPLADPAVGADGASAPYAPSDTRAARATVPNPPAQRRSISRRVDGGLANRPQWCMSGSVLVSRSGLGRELRSFQEDEFLDVDEDMSEISPGPLVFAPPFGRNAQLAPVALEEAQ